MVPGHSLVTVVTQGEGQGQRGGSHGVCALVCDKRMYKLKLGALAMSFFDALFAGGLDELRVCLCMFVYVGGCLCVCACVYV